MDNYLNCCWACGHVDEMLKCDNIYIKMKAGEKYFPVLL